MASPYAPSAPPGAMFGTAAFHPPGYPVSSAPAAPPLPTPSEIKRKQRRAMVVVSSLFLLGAGITILILGLAAEGEYRKAIKGAGACIKTHDSRFNEGTCMITKCSHKAPQGLVGTAAMLSVQIVFIATTYGRCPCCKPGKYIKDKIFYLAIAFLILLWVHFVLDFVYVLSVMATLTVRTSDELCIRVAKGRIAGVGMLGLLVGIFGSAHTLMAGLSRAKIADMENSIPIAMPVQG